MDIIDLNHQKITESTFSFPEFVVAWKNQFIPSAHFWDTVNFRVPWSDFHMNRPDQIFLQLLVFVNLYQHAKNEAVSLICSEEKDDLKILQSYWLRVFWPISQNNIFPKYRICVGTQKVIQIFII